ncbi:Hypothetical predicted protein [Pelobates cultripes]|uniref:Uncharacterized protein n=1 Tax=Pelobates cultripes TaxID=61616 RepID=A0AAD1R269_PELCU|nr:Hypothetical predicted protein [Pelobates cultripes]
MVRNKRPRLLGTSQQHSPRRPTGTMDDFVSTPAELWGARLVDKMVPTSPSAGESVEGSEGDDALTLIRQELSRISAQMLTKADTSNLLQEFGTAVREEISTLRTDLPAVEVRVDALETEAQACRNQWPPARVTSCSPNAARLKTWKIAAAAII